MITRSDGDTVNLSHIDEATRALVQIAGVIAGGDEVMTRQVMESVAGKADGSRVDEVIIQSYLFAGFPRTLNAARIVRNGDVALLYSDWTISSTSPEGVISTIDVRPTHVARQQPDGEWKFVIDDPSVDEPPAGARS